MLLTQNYRPRQLTSRHHQQLSPKNRPAPLQFSSQLQTSPFLADDLDLDIKLELEADAQSLSSSPLSTQSLLSQYSVVPGGTLTTALDSIPSLAIPRVSSQQQQVGLYDFATPLASALDEPSLFSSGDVMQTEPWLQATQFIPKPLSRGHHQRDSSISSMASTAGPASPYSQNTVNPQIAVTDSSGDFHGLPNVDDFQMNLKPYPSATHDTFYANYPTFAASADAAANPAFSSMSSHPAMRTAQSMLPLPSETPGLHSRSRPVSAASSVASDSPATPTAELGEDKRRKAGQTCNDTYSRLPDTTAFPMMPKFTRTMTDAYNDELYNPNFSIASSSPNQISLSPRNDTFAKRVQAANNQHLTTAPSPVSTVSRGRSPFRNGSPLAPMPAHEFPSAAQLAFASARAYHEQDAALRHMATTAPTNGTPQTISPKDAMLELNPVEGEANFPLFPPQDTAGFSVAHLKATAQPSFDNLGDLDDGSFDNYVTHQLPTNLSIPQQYPFVAQPPPQVVHAPLAMDHGSLNSSRYSSTESGTTDSIHGISSPTKPAGATADGGTYTCTYHGCTMRFETPAMLQKHKREGHRQAAHGITTQRRPEVVTGTGMTSSLLGSQAGPHKCDRINPSTNKPCNTIFSRPYDLTRHEDTIHNARKQKVRCNLCTDDKTFSRADALTRHYRVCHPDVEFSGKQRRRTAVRA